MSDTEKLYRELTSAVTAYKSASAQNAGISSAKDRVKNLMFNSREAILGVMQERSSLFSKIAEEQEKSQMLERALAEMDEENDELRKNIKRLQTELDDLYDQHNHDVQELEMQIEQQEGKKSSIRRKKAKVLTAVVEAEE